MSREILTPSADVVSDLSVSQKVCSTPWNSCGSQQVVTALSVLCSPPHLGVFIAVVEVAIGLPSHPFLKSFLFQSPKQIKIVQLQVFQVMSWLTDVRPSAHLPLFPWWVRLNQFQVWSKLYRSLDSISQVYSLVKATSVSVRLRSNSYRLRSANNLPHTCSCTWCCIQRDGGKEIMALLVLRTRELLKFISTKI